MRVSGPDMFKYNRSETFILKFVSPNFIIGFLKNFPT